MYDRDFEGLAGGFQPKSGATPAFTCGDQLLTYADIRGNAFYCGGPGDDYIAWDAAELFPQLSERFGPIAPAIVLAHEMGHAVQARAGVDAPSVVRELQADCFAGSWIRFAEASTDDAVTLAKGDLDNAVATVLVFRDQPGSAASAPQAHGLGFDRVNAFQTGYEQGADRCAEFPRQGVVTTELPFRTVSEARSGGNLPFAETIDLLSADLDQFWSSALPRLARGAGFTAPSRRPIESGTPSDCPGVQNPDLLSDYCPATNAVTWSTQRVMAAHEQIGDLATGAALSDAWAEAAQNQARLQTTGLQSGLQRDCFTGAWLASLAEGDLATSRLSPGDIDEALVEIVVSSFTDDGPGTDRGGAFQRTNRFRTGILNGLPACS